MWTNYRCAMAGCLSVVLLGCSTGTREKILNIQTELSVRADGTVLADETITVNVAGQEIKRGIYRDILNVHHGQAGQLRVIGASRDGESVPFKVENLGQRTRIRIVREDGLLSHGTHTFRVQYEVQNRVETRGAQRKLEWSVTGTKWKFPIDEISARVHLPEGTDMERVQSSSRFHSSDAKHPGRHDRTTDTFQFRADRNVEPGDEFAIALEWTVE